MAASATAGFKTVLTSVRRLQPVMDVCPSAQGKRSLLDVPPLLLHLHLEAVATRVAFFCGHCSVVNMRTKARSSTSSGSNCKA